uniref:NADH-ubiquinone oxidoreductase chain 2 n=1 Tax=Cyrtodactylus rosichonarieforum TaxID=3146277 RepID=A0A0K0Y0X0_9SAUR|nr:NADH dehydrogenase subunit 2 [Cyrtodactylus rosichonariefi]
MNPLIWATMTTTLLISSIITMSSNHWLLAWFGLELNTLSILPMIMKQHHPRATEATTKYFLIQVIAATMILLASTTNAWQTGQWSITHSTPTTTLIITMAIMLKLGAAPTYMWYPHVLQGVTMNTALLISTWQKLAPLALLYMIHNHLNHTTMLALGLLSATIGGLAGLNQTQTRTIMAFSSIAHMGWLITAITLNPSLTTLTMMTYMMMTTATFMPLATTSKNMVDIGASWSLSPTTLTTSMIMLMSLGGLPPLTGFMPKWLILKEMTSTGLPLLATLLLMMSLPSLFFYIRLAYLTMLTVAPTTTNSEHKWRFKAHSKYTTQMIMASVLLLPMTTVLYTTT